MASTRGRRTPTTASSSHITRPTATSRTWTARLRMAGCLVRTRIPRLARIAVSDEDVPHLQGELNAILSFVEQLNEVDVAGVEPMTLVTPMTMKKRQDGVADGGYPEK